ncbi:MAG TPA: hypothetical protein VMZ03_06420 [Chitinophagaceae bacterium]|nr:hypothetical protein [Chitinophagaceae bacterium]
MRSFFLIYGLFVITACNNKAKKGDSKKEDNTKVSYDETHLSTDTVFTAFGNEPFWAVYIINNNKIVFHPADGPDVEVPWIQATTPNETTRRYTSFGNGNEIDMTIVQKNCSDGMSDETHPYTVTLSVNKENYSGCGRQFK